ncbi:MAG: DUF4339 domain-containing protein [Phycisphaerae bacterium]|nr:DUF4339 domain-containing protein [Phycisphaerae bacterium]
MEGLRYLADLFDSAPLPPTERPPIVIASMGPSVRFQCETCGREFESLKPTGRPEGQCPHCGTVTKTPITPAVDFPREYASDAQSAAPAAPKEGGWIMDGDFLVAPRSPNQDPSDSIIQGLPLLSNEQSAPGSDLAEARKSSSDIEAHLAARMAPESAAESGDRREWFYLLREHQHGPVSTAKLQHLIQNGKVGLSVLVFHEGLKGWRPIEEFEELRVFAKTPDVPEPFAEVKSSSALTLQELRRLHRKFVRLLWLFIIAGFVFTLGLVMRQSLYALGGKFFTRANLMLSLLIFLAVLYGGSLLIRWWVIFRRAPLSVRLRTWIGMGGLLVCMVTTLTLALSWRGEGQAQLDRDSIMTAQRIFIVLRGGKVEDSHVSVDWGNLRVNGVEFGQRFDAAHSRADRQKLMDSVCEVFLTAFEPYFHHDELNYPMHLDTWRVVHRDAGDTTVEVRIPSTGRILRFTLRANRLVGLDLP